MGHVTILNDIHASHPDGFMLRSYEQCMLAKSGGLLWQLISCQITFVCRSHVLGEKGFILEIVGDMPCITAPQTYIGVLYSSILSFLGNLNVCQVNFGYPYGRDHMIRVAFFVSLDIRKGMRMPLPAPTGSIPAHSIAQGVPPFVPLRGHTTYTDRCI